MLLDNRIPAPNSSAAEPVSLEAEGPRAEADSTWDGSLAAGVARSLFWGYRILLSSQDSISCSFEPSCSHFSQEAIDEHGFVEGILATLDRFDREGPLSPLYYPTDPDSGLLLDPPEGYCLGCSIEYSGLRPPPVSRQSRLPP